MNAQRPPPIFDHALARQRRMRAAARFAEHSALHDAVRDELAERLAGVTRGFPSVLLLGGVELAVKGAEFVVTDVESHFGRQSGNVPPPLEGEVRWGGTPQYRAMGLRKAPSPSPSLKGEGDNMVLAETLALNKIIFPITLDDEIPPFAAHSFDLIISHLALQTVNDVPGQLARIYNLLKPGGLFLAAFAGGYTLHEFRTCLMEAELAVTGGVSPRLHPAISLTDASALLQRAGFQLPVTDNEVFALTYPDAFYLMRDLRGMGASNVLYQRLKIPTRRAVFVEAAKLYQEKFAQDGRIPASFDIIFLHGWKS